MGITIHAHVTIAINLHWLMPVCRWSTKISQLDRQRSVFNVAQGLLRSGNMEAAAQTCESGLEQFPKDANLICLCARAHLAMRHFDRVRNYLDSVMQDYPDFAVAHDVSGDLLLLEGSYAKAIEAYEKSLALGASKTTAKQKISKAGQMQKKAVAATRKQQAYADELAEAEQHERDGDQKAAEEIYRSILKEDPNHIEASRLLAGVAVAHEEYQEAKVFLHHVLKLAPDYLRALVDLTNVLRQMEEFEEAIATARRVVELSPENAEAYMVYASALGVAGQHEAAIEAYEQARFLNPDKAAALCGMAHHLKTIGQQDRAIAGYRQCIALKPDHSEAYWSLANLKTFRFTNAEVEAMHVLLQSGELDDESRAQVHNALGLEYEAQKEFAKAYEHFSQCNLSRRKLEFYDPVDTEDTHERVMELFTEQFLSQTPAPASGTTPIFVVGLPRSGSTLIEQILASHSMVDGTHELSDLSKVVRGIRRKRKRKVRYPEVLANFNVEKWADIGRQYIERTIKHRGNSPFFIDKNPNNFVFAGLIKLAIPNAKIINARRHPLDSCLGSFKQLFASGQPFSYDTTELSEYYLQYQLLMDHWHRVMPGFVLDVNYEDVVGDLDAQVLRILDFCGLPFEEACLRFHETKRAVKTASSEQVRQPIYSTSVNLWRNYEAQLSEMIEVLDPLLKSLPERDQPEAFNQRNSS